MNPKGKKLIALFLIFLLLTINCAFLKRLEEARERGKKHGAKLEIWGKEGKFIQSELITVKPNSLLLLDTKGNDVSVGIEEIKIIKIMKNSKFWKGGSIGALIGAGGGTLIGYAMAEGYSGVLSVRREAQALFWALVFGTLGALLGAIIGATTGPGKKTIHFEGMTDLEIQETLDYLRKKARIRDYK